MSSTFECSRNDVASNVGVLAAAGLVGLTGSAWPDIIVGGLIASQLLTLLTTPVVYVLLDRLRRRRGDQAHLARGVGAVGAAGAT